MTSPRHTDYPPLPEYSDLGDSGASNYGYSADDMRAYVDADRAAIPPEPAAEVKADAGAITGGLGVDGYDPLRELHDLLYMAQRIEGAQRDKAIGRARVIVHRLRDNAQSCLTPEELKGAALTPPAPNQGDES